MLLEAFGTLLRDPNHWLFEFMVGGIEEIVTGVFIGAFIWPRIMKHWHKDAPHRDVQTLWTPEEIRIAELEVGSVIKIHSREWHRRSAAAKKGWETRRRYEAD